MYLKLNFSSNTSIMSCLRLLTSIVNDNTITSISALQSKAGNWNAANTVDYDTSEIIRTVDPVNTKCQINNGTTYDYSFYFNMEQRVHDDPNTKYYICYDSNSGTSTAATSSYQARVRVASGLAGGTIDASGFSVTTGNNDDFQGTYVRPGGSINTGGWAVSQGSNGSNIRTFGVYLTDETFMWYATNQPTALGFGTTYNAATSYTGINIFSQYERYDHHNNPGNGIIPLFYSFPWGTAASFGANEHWDNTVNNNNIYGPHGFKVFNLVNAQHRIGNSYPIEYNPRVAQTIGSRNYEHAAGTYRNNDTAGINDLSVERVIDKTADYRHATSDLNSAGFGLLPLGWANTVKGNMGGDVTSISNVYVFNGDYFPGDEFGLGEKIYTIWPGYAGYTNRLGIAIPKE